MTNDFLRRARLIGMMSVLTVVMLVLAACGGGDDDDDADADVEATSATTTSAVTSPTVTTDSTTEPTTAATNTIAVASPTEEEDDEPTATVEATSTEEADDDASPTADTASASPDDEGEDALGEIEPIDPEALPNYTMTFDFEIVGLGDDLDATVSLLIEQADLNNYHMRVDTDGEVVEVWQLGETSYISQGGTDAIEVPAGSGQELFTPALFLQALPPFPPEMNVQDEGTEEVEGRKARRYTVDGEDYLAASDLGDVSELSDIEGGVEILVDEELNILLFMDADITWTNPDGSEGSFIGTQEIRNIGDTPEITAP